MDFETYARSKFAIYAAFAGTVGAILQAAIRHHSDELRLQQLQHRAKAPDSLLKKLQARGAEATSFLEDEIKDLGGCRLIFYSNADVARFLSSGIVSDNFDVDWDRTKIHHPIPGQTEPDNLFISNNYVVKLQADRAELAEYRRFEGLYCEVQVQTILNHAWSEMTHDVIYKAPKLTGFGNRQLAAIQQRLRDVMKTHLLPSGYEFQKALTDYERLLSGKELLDRGALKAAIECSDNNERRDVLERFRDYVLPHYDDLESVFADIRDQLVAVVIAARATRQKPIETPFGRFSGTTVDQIVDVVADIFSFVRYVDVEGTFNAICNLFPGALTDQERKHLLGVIEKLARHDLDVWKQAGPVIQMILVQRIRRMDGTTRKAVRPIIVATLDEALKSELRGSSSTYNTVTLKHGPALGSDALMRMRAEAIQLLAELYETTESETEKRKTKQAMFKATRFPSFGSASNELAVCILENSVTIVDFFTARVSTESYEILQIVEQSLLWLYRHGGGLAAGGTSDQAVDAARKKLGESILRFRDVANANRRFVIYKTLVGFQSVFPPEWNNAKFEYEQKEKYRGQRIAELVAEVGEANADEWLSIIERCAETRSDDMATSPSFGVFLQRLSATRPTIVLGYLDRLSERLTAFLGVMLSGLAEGDCCQDQLEAKVSEWISEEKHLPELAHYMQFAKRFDPKLLTTVLDLGLKRKDDDVVIQVTSTLGKRYADAPDGLVESVLLPAIRYFTEKRDARWVNLLWFLPDDRTPLLHLSREQIDMVLKNLVHLPEIESHGERVLSWLAKTQPEKVFDFFGRRLAYEEARESNGRYEAVPHSFHGLEKRFAAIVEHALETVRRKFVRGDGMFQFGGGRLLATTFPDLSGRFKDKLLGYLRSVDREDIEFVIQTLSAYPGEISLNEACREVVRALPPDDDLLGHIDTLLDARGGVWGEFGLVEAYKQKKQEMSDWLADPDVHVVAFAEKHIRMLDRQMAAEQRRSEESLEMRKRMYDQRPNGDDDGTS